MNFQTFKPDLEKAEEPEIKLLTFIRSSMKQEFQENIYFCFIDKVTVWISTNWKILQEMGIPDHTTCLVRNLCRSRSKLELDIEQTVSKSGEGIHQCCILSPLVNLYAECIMRNG